MSHQWRKYAEVGINETQLVIVAFVSKVSYSCVNVKGKSQLKRI